MITATFVTMMAAYNAELNRRLYAAASRLTEARIRADAAIEAWAQTIDEAWLAEDQVWFSGAAQRDLRKPRGLLLAHMFNHQTHHRGQAHPLLTASGQATGDYRSVSRAGSLNDTGLQCPQYGGMTRRARPYYNLKSLKAAFSDPVRINRTMTATDGADDIGMDEQAVVDVIGGLTSCDFDKSMPSEVDPAVQQDVYKPSVGGRELYVKFTVDSRGELLLISFKENVG